MAHIFQEIKRKREKEKKKREFSRRHSSPAACITSALGVFRKQIIQVGGIPPAAPIPELRAGGQAGLAVQVEVVKHVARHIGRAAVALPLG